VREDPLLVVLDEPTSALDAETEHALFERFAEQARVASEAGRVTVLVSHRFSTVRMADLIVVMSGSRVVEVGTHEELVSLGGTYAELYAIQAARLPLTAEALGPGADRADVDGCLTWPGDVPTVSRQIRTSEVPGTVPAREVRPWDDVTG
jgi:ABC-type multidrug transport system ATPase subunit